MGSFVLGGTEVAERRVQPAGVVPALDVLEDGASKSGSRSPCSRVDELSLNGGEERSATALSQRSSLRPTESTTPLARAKAAKSPLVSRATVAKSPLAYWASPCRNEK